MADQFNAKCYQSPPVSLDCSDGSVVNVSRQKPDTTAACQFFTARRKRVANVNILGDVGQMLLQVNISRPG